MNVILYSILITIFSTLLLNHCSSDLGTKINTNPKVVEDKDSGSAEFAPEKPKNFPDVFGDIYNKNRLAIPEGVKPIPKLDLERYYGRWYEVARLDHKFERGLTEVMAEYSRRDDGVVKVQNTGYFPGDDKFKIARGRAKYVDPDNKNGHLKVSFFGPFFSSYIVFYIEQEDPKDPKSRYSIALVSGNTRNYCWILSRTPNISRKKLNYLLKIVRKHGFSTEDLIIMDGKPTHLLNRCNGGKEC